MTQDRAEAARVNELDREVALNGQEAQSRLFDDAYGNNGATGCGDKPAALPKPELNERGGVVARDANGHITRVDYPDGVTYEYSRSEEHTS